MRTPFAETVICGVLLAACTGPGEAVSGGEWIGTPISARPAPEEAAPAPPPVTAAPATPQTPPSDLPRPGRMATEGGMPFAPGEGIAAESSAEIRKIILEARARAAGGDVAGAIAALRDAEFKAPRDPEVPLAMGRIFQAAGRYSDAVSSFRRARSKGPERADALYGEIFALLKLGQATSAQPLVARLEKMRPGDVQVERLKAAVLSGGGNVDEALAVRAQIADKEDGPGARRELADALARAGRHAEAADAYAKAAGKAPEDADLQLRLGTSRGLAGDLAGAESALAKSTRLAPKNAAAWKALARVREQKGDLDGAAKAWTGLIERSEGGDAAQAKARIERLQAEAARRAEEEE